MSDVRTAGPWKRIYEHHWTPSLVTLLVSVVFSLTFWAGTRPDGGAKIGDTVRLEDFEYTPTALTCRSMAGANPETEQICHGKVAVVNQGIDEGHPEDVQAWLVAIDGRRFQAIDETRRALNQDVEPGDAVFVPLEFRPPAGLAFEAMELGLEKTGETVSVEVFVGEGMSLRR